MQSTSSPCIVKAYPMKYNAGACLTDNGPDFPIVYDYGDNVTTNNFYGPNSRGRMSLSFLCWQ